ncbi:Mss4-like protein [Melanogaster broomeanus]|nr:Mss4-like protein [Melanogaster broomeanus]
MDAPAGSIPILKGSCFCATVTFAMFAPPVRSAYCHCTNCQRLMGKIYIPTACPFAATSVLNYYENPSKPYKRRFWCKKCGVAVASYNTNTGQYSVWGANLERGLDGEILNWEVAKPTAHQFYETRMLDVNDELGKWEGYEGKSVMIAD